MSDSIRYEAICALSKVLESNIITNGNHRVILEQAIATLHQGVRPIVDVETQVAKAAPAKKPKAVKEEKAVEKVVEQSAVDPFYNEAVEFLQGETKPNPKQLQTKFKIGAKRAKEMFEAMVEVGDVKPFKRPETKPAKKEAVKSVKELIADLPEGSNPLLKAPFDLLLVLTSKDRAPYLAGLKLEDYVDNEKLSQAVSDGADKSLVDQVIRLTDRERPTPKPEMIIDWKQHESNVVKWTNAIPNGGDLFNHMAAKGVTKKVLSHFKSIATAVENNEV